MENYYWNEEDIRDSNKLYILIIYDITSNKRRSHFVKYLLGIGMRVQKSAFEAVVSMRLYRKLLKDVHRYINEDEDSVRVYRLMGNSEVSLFGKNIDFEEEELIIL